MEKRINSYSILVILMAFFSFTTLTYQFYPFINRLLGVILLFFFIICFFSTIKRRDLWLIVATLAVNVLSIRYMRDANKNINDAIYWDITLLFIWKMCDKNFTKRFYEASIKQKKVLEIFSILNCLLITVTLFLPFCYNNSWDGHYYNCFSLGSHSVCCGILLSLVMVFYWYGDIKNNLVKLLFIIPFAIGILETGARTYLIPLIIVVFLLFKYEIHNVTFKTLAIPVVVTAFVIVFFNSGIADKFLWASNNIWTGSEKMSSISSGRTTFWMIDINAYSSLGLIDRVFGTSFDYVYYINLRDYGMSIWAHNDFINTLLCNGLFGLCIYVYVTFKVLVSFYLKKSKFLIFIIFMFFFTTTFVNGFFANQHLLFAYMFLVNYFQNSQFQTKKKNTNISDLVYNT